MNMAAPLLALQSLQAGYAGARVLHGIQLDLLAGETLVVLGRNGVGKTTLIETIMGLTEHQGGAILLDGQPIGHRPPHWRNRAGIAWVPQQREVFRGLTVAENLAVVQRPAGSAPVRRSLLKIDCPLVERASVGHCAAP